MPTTELKFLSDFSDVNVNTSRMFHFESYTYISLNFQRFHLIGSMTRVHLNYQILNFKRIKYIVQNQGHFQNISPNSPHKQT